MGAATPIAYVRSRPAERRRPPVSARGPFAWLRQNLFSTPFNAVLTIVAMLALAWLVPPVIRFLLIDAVWVGADREACLAGQDGREVGACWPFVRERIFYFIYGSYPLGERWRVDLFFALFAFGAGWLLWLEAPRRTLGAAYFFVVLPIASFILLSGWPAVGLARVDTALWGGLLVTVVVAAVGIVLSLPLGIVLGTGAAIEHADRQVLLRRLHRIRARCAADHRPVHGERHAASVRAAGVVARQALARARRRDGVLGRLHGRGGARRARRHPSRPVRGRAGARPELRPDDAADRAAAGAAHHHSQHRQQHRGAVQGHDAGVLRRHLRFPAHHRGGARRSQMGDAGDQRHRLCLRGIVLFRVLLVDVALCPKAGAAAVGRASRR